MYDRPHNEQRWLIFHIGKLTELSCRKLEKFEEKLRHHSLAGQPDLLPRLRKLQEKLALRDQVRVAKKEAKTAGSIILLDELKHRERMLHRLE
jgi:hypothetical protein